MKPAARQPRYAAAAAVDRNPEPWRDPRGSREPASARPAHRNPAVCRLGAAVRGLALAVAVLALAACAHQRPDDPSATPVRERVIAPVSLGARCRRGHPRPHAPSVPHHAAGVAAPQR